MAKSLFISQPALTAKIKAIEMELGVTLLIRNNKGIEFTSIGKYVAQHAEAMLSDYLRFKEELKTMSQGVVGNLRIVTPYIFSKYHLPGIIAEFQKIHANVNFDIATVHSCDVLMYLKTNFYHFGFVRNNQEDGSDNMLHVESSEIYIVYKKAFSLDELPQLKRIEYQTDLSYKLFLDEWWNYHFDTPPTIGARVSDLETCREMVLSGVGYAFLPRFVIPKDNDLYAYPMSSVKKEPIMRHTWMVYQDEVLQRQLPRVFYEFVKKYYSGVSVAPTMMQSQV